VQTTLLGLAIAMILALLAALVGPHVVNWNDYRAFFEAEASRIIGLKVRVSGNIDAGILPFPSVTLRDIAIGPDGRASRFNARSLRIELGLGSLMRGELRATEMRLVAPQFSIGLDRRGQLDWPPLVLATETLSIDRLSIEDGRVALTDAKSGSRLVLDQLWFTGEVRSLTGPFRGRGEFVIDDGLHAYDVSAGRLGPEGIRLKLSLKTDQRPLIIEADGTLAFERATPHFDGGVTAAWPVGAVPANGKAAIYEPWRVTGKVKADASAATIEDMSIQYGPDERAATLAGAANFRFGAQPEFHGTLTARQIDLDRLFGVPDRQRQLPLSAARMFGELIDDAPRPAWPARLSVNIDTITLGGATLQNVGSEIRSDGANWTLDKLDFRAPGFSQIKLGGRFYPQGKGLGFAGGVGVDSNDPRKLVAWLTGRTATSVEIKPWRAKGDITLGTDRIAVERLWVEFDRGSVEGSLAYTWPAGSKLARFDADLRAANLDLDAVLSEGSAVQSAMGLEQPGEVVLALEMTRARIAGFDAERVAARIALDADGLAIERLVIEDFGSSRITASGHIRTLQSPTGTIAADINIKDLNAVAALSEKLAPSLAAPLRRLASRQKSAELRAVVSVEGSGTDDAVGTFGLNGQVGPVAISVSARANGKREALAARYLSSLGDADVHIDGRLDSEEGAALLALLGIDRMKAPDSRPARFSISANGALGSELHFEGKIDAGPIDVDGRGVIRFPSGRPVAIDLNQFEGAVDGSKVQGRLEFQLGETVRVMGTVKMDSLDAPELVVAATGMTAHSRSGEAVTGWSSEPFAWGVSRVTGRVEFNAQRAIVAPTLVVQSLRGVAHFGGSELTFEDVTGELGNGRLEGSMAIASGVDGVSGRLRIDLTEAEAGAIFAIARGPAISGRLALHVELEGVGRSPAAFMGSLAGAGAITLERAEFAGLNPGMFDTVTRAFERSDMTDSSRIGHFVAGELDNASLPVSLAKATLVIRAGQARFADVVIRASGADIEAAASVDLANAKLNAMLTFTGLATASGALRPVVLVSLNGPLLSPKRTIDASLLTSWLMLRAVEQQSKQIDALERARREMPPADGSPDATGGLPADIRAPAVPPNNVPPASKPRAGRTIPTPALIGSPELVGRQH
jgi:uncharacterized protein involved in outer membrane biogenesis